MKLIVKGNVKSQKNNKMIAQNTKTGKPFIMTKKSTNDFIDSAVGQLKEQFRGYRVTNYPISVQMIFYYKTKHRKDIDNSATTILDCMVKAGVVEDDDVKHINELYVFFADYDKDNPRVEIILEDC